jgi:acyl-CoA synthetase (AMP-forming)/AMP-acid ligase II
MIRRMREELSFRVILTAYGLTESTGTITMCRVDDDPETISSTSGRAITDVEVRVVDENDIEVPRGTAGEIVCRGYNVMPGYFADPAATADTVDENGWLHTGDIGIMNERGYLAITDRLKDMFIVGGFNAYPAEIENALLGHPGVAQVAVVGRPDERMGEVGHAFVVRRADRSCDADEIIEWSRARMANYKVPRGITFVDALPLNASGKVLKFELRERLK